MTQVCLTLATQADIDYCYENVDKGVGFLNKPKNWTVGQALTAWGDDGIIATFGASCPTPTSETAFVWVCGVDPKKDIRPFIAIAKEFIKIAGRHYPNLLCTINRNSPRAKRFAEFLGFKVDKEKSDRYNHKEYDIMRYHG